MKKVCLTIILLMSVNANAVRGIVISCPQQVKSNFSMDASKGQMYEIVRALDFKFSKNYLKIFSYDAGQTFSSSFYYEEPQIIKNKDNQEEWGYISAIKYILNDQIEYSQGKRSFSFTIKKNYAGANALFYGDKIDDSVIIEPRSPDDKIKMDYFFENAGKKRQSEESEEIGLTIAEYSSMPSDLNSSFSYYYELRCNISFFKPAE